MTLARDKLLHFAFGVLAALAGVGLAMLNTVAGVAWTALAAGILVGCTYELVQIIRKEGDPSWPDVAATVAGSAAVAVLVALVI